MDILELKDLIDSTINTNNDRSITGLSLNLVLHEIVSAIESLNVPPQEEVQPDPEPDVQPEDKVENEVITSPNIITILLPNDDTFEDDVNNPELLENNKKCFTALKDQTEPLIIFLKYIGSTKPLSQIALRLRHLYTKGEGTDFFAFGYPSTYSNEFIIGGLALASDMWLMNEDGSIVKIDYDGIDVNIDVMELLEGSYNHSLAEGNLTLSSGYLPKITKDSDGQWIVENLYGSYLDGNKAYIEYDKDNNVLTVKGGWDHSTIGPGISDDIHFSVNLNTLELTQMEETINFAFGSYSAIGYKLTKME